METIESANAIATRQLINLAEEEVIAYNGTCQMNNGGWPQNVYNNMFMEKSVNYNADWLYTVTAVLVGESYNALEYEMGI